jgi:hypothetical protein
MATLTSIGSALYDSGTTDPTELAVAIERKAGVSLLQALSAARGVIAAKTKTATDTVTDTVDSLGDVAGVLKDSLDAPVRVVKWLTDPNSWVRVAYVVGGFVFIWLGALKLEADALTPVVNKVAGVATAVVPAGKVAKVAGTAARAVKAAKG